jgi:hypothetical protein
MTPGRWGAGGRLYYQACAWLSPKFPITLVSDARVIARSRGAGWSAFEPDRRERHQGDPGRAQRAGTVGRVDDHVVLVDRDHVVEEVEHRRRERERVLRAQQVGTGDRAHQRRAAGQEEDLLIGPAGVSDGGGDGSGVWPGVSSAVKRRDPTAKASPWRTGRYR